MRVAKCVLFAAACAVLFAGTVETADAQGRGYGYGRGGAGGPGRGSAFTEDHQDFQFLLQHHDQIARKITVLDNGVDTLTESNDPAVAAKIQEHVAGMYKRVQTGSPIHMRDPLFAEVFRNVDKIKIEHEATDNGVRVIETSDDPYVAKLIQAHAEVVSLFVKNGHIEAARNHAVPGSEATTLTSVGAQGCPAAKCSSCPNAGKCPEAKCSVCPNATKCDAAKCNACPSAGTCDKAKCSACPNATKCDAAKCDACPNAGNCDKAKCEACPNAAKCDAAKCNACPNAGTCDKAKCSVCPNATKCDAAKCNACPSAGTCDKAKCSACPNATKCDAAKCDACPNAGKCETCPKAGACCESGCSAGGSCSTGQDAPHPSLDKKPAVDLDGAMRELLKRSQ